MLVCKDFIFKNQIIEMKGGKKNERTNKFKYIL